MTETLKKTAKANAPLKRAAFTLAEVLITLGIIGVVAALTLPTLIQKHRKTAVETSLAKFYSVMNQTIAMAEVNEGDKTQWQTFKIVRPTKPDGSIDYSSTLPDNEFFDRYLRPYLKADKIELDTISGKHVVWFPDGSVAAIGPASIQFWPKASDYKVFNRDENGTLINDIQSSGIKYFTFYLQPSTKDPNSKKYYYAKGVEPYKNGWDGQRSTLFTDSAKGCKESPTLERAYCTALIQMNGWKIPDDYPFKF